MRKGIFQNVALNILMGLLLFVPAGTLAWPRAWAFLVIFNACSQATGVWLLKHDPELLAERMKSPFSADQRPRDRLVIRTVVLFFCVWLACMGLDTRFGWSHAPLWAGVIGAVLTVAAFYGWIGVLRANSFASVAVRVQRERGQTVVSSGPYVIVRHPMYAYAVLLLFGMPLLLGSLWGLLGVPVATALLAARILGEEEVLTDGLAGYPEYAAKVRYRLVPWVW